MRLIDADELRQGWLERDPYDTIEANTVLYSIDDQPTINPEDLRPKGKWIIGEMGPVGVPIHCSKCGWGADHADPNTWLKYQGHNFCGACGAKMEE